MAARRRMWIALSLVALVFLLVTCNAVGRLAGLSVARQSADEVSALLRPADSVHLPAGDGPFPTALLFSGCDGPRDNLDRWAAMLNGAGWAAVIVDSHGPRGFDQAQIWRLICAGQLLTGAERAADVVVSLRDIREAPFADPDRIALIGASHGGWAVLEALAYAGRGRLPPNLRRAGAPSPAAMLDGAVGAILLYPYCGIASRVSRWGWQADLPVLFLLVEGDTIADDAACRDLAGRMAADGRPVERVDFAGVTHGFDQQEKAPLSTLGYDPEATARALDIGRDFLRELD